MPFFYVKKVKLTKVQDKRVRGGHVAKSTGVECSQNRTSQRRKG
jgi:hypothetical protein